MKTKILGLLAVGLLAGPMAANAITLSAGQSVIYNFDFTGVTPSAPYGNIYIIWRSLDYSLSDGVNRQVFSELNLGGTMEFENVGFPVSTTSFSPQLQPGMMDGVFSVLIEATAGSFSVDPLAYSLVNGVRTSLVAPTIGSVPTPTPEPGTLALLGLGLAGLGLSRRRKPN